MPRLAKPRVLITAALLLAGAGAAAIVAGDLSATSAEAPQAAAPAAVPVDIAEVETQPVRLWRTFSARLVAVDEVDLRPQVSGRIEEIRFRDGETVEAGDVLFVIDPAPYKAAVAQAKADLAAARDRRTFAHQEAQRAERLIKTSAVAERVLDERRNAFAVAGSEVLAAEARLESAEIDLDRAQVKAPISGRVSRAEVTAGNLVAAGPTAPVLTTIVSQDRIYADFDVDEATYLEFVRAGAHDAAAERTIPVRMSIGGGETAYDGRIHSFDNRIDPATATIRARALFENPDGRLLPGMFAEVELGTAGERDVILLSERAVLTDQDRKFVWVVGDDGRAGYREVRLGAAVGDKRVVTRGLESGERVIVGGMMGVRPNAEVTQRPAPENTEAAAKVAESR